MGGTSEKSTTQYVQKEILKEKTSKSYHQPKSGRRREHNRVDIMKESIYMEDDDSFEIVSERRSGQTTAQGRRVHLPNTSAIRSRQKIVEPRQTIDLVPHDELVERLAERHKRPQSLPFHSSNPIRKLEPVDNTPTEIPCFSDAYTRPLSLKSACSKKRSVKKGSVKHDSSSTSPKDVNIATPSKEKKEKKKDGDSEDVEWDLVSAVNATDSAPNGNKVKKGWFWGFF